MSMVTLPREVVERALRAIESVTQEGGEIFGDWDGMDESALALRAALAAGEARPESVVHVCPEKDIVCGSRPENWCRTCPLAAPPQPAEVTDEMVEAACKTFSEESLGYSGESRREYMIRYLPMRAALVAAMGAKR